MAWFPFIQMLNRHADKLFHAGKGKKPNTLVINFVKYIDVIWGVTDQLLEQFLCWWFVLRRKYLVGLGIDVAGVGGFGSKTCSYAGLYHAHGQRLWSCESKVLHCTRQNISGAARGNVISLSLLFMLPGDFSWMPDKDLRVNTYQYNHLGARTAVCSVSFLLFLLKHAPRCHMS